MGIARGVTGKELYKTKYQSILSIFCFTKSLFFKNRLFVKTENKQTLYLSVNIMFFWGKVCFILFY